jgi:acyl-[acyl-carrier-protein]-phospholipid O-acyltransferase/long-chain-fatty-acid--[acyl-carrier-protein] ligase
MANLVRKPTTIGTHMTSETVPVHVPLAAPQSHGETVWSWRFLSLLGTQFLTAVNDHTFRWYAVGLAKDFAPEAGKQEFQSYVMAAGAFALALPALFLAAPAGYLADRFSKRAVTVGCKLAEVGAIVLGLLGVATGNMVLIFAALMLLGVIATLFVPAKIGAIPEILHPHQLSQANGLFQLVTIVAIVAGAVLGSLLADLGGNRGLGNLGTPSLVFLGIAAIGVLLAWNIGSLTAGNPQRCFPWNFAKQTALDLRDLFSHRALFRVALGIAFFYAVGVLAQMNVDRLATESGAASESAKSPLLVALILGVSVGSLLAGYWSGNRVELGILPIGAAGVALCATLMFTVPAQLFHEGTSHTAGYYWASLLLFGLGTSAGLFLVPLESYMQHHSDPHKRGSLLAASNFLTCSGTLVTSLLFVGLAKVPGFTPRHIFLLCGGVTVPVVIYIVWLIPGALIRFVVWLATRTIYRVRVVGRENLPPRGGAVLTPNHISWLDAILLVFASSRPIRMLAWSGNFESRLMRWMAGLFDVILVNPNKPKMIVAALREARQAVLDGELVCIFPEGGISRSGHLLGFKPGLMKVLEGTGAPVIPVYLDGLWGSIFSFERGRFFWKWPKRVPYPVAIHFGPAVDHPTDVQPIRQAVANLGAQAALTRVEPTMLLPRAFLRRFKSRLRRSKVADTMGADLTGGQLLLRTLILRRLLRRVLGSQERVVGLLLPPSAPGFMANMALTLDGRVTANLNYTTSVEVMNQCVRAAGIKHVVTSRRFMSKMPFSGLEAEIVYLEDFKDQVTLADKVAAATMAYAVPAAVLERALGVTRLKADDTATIIFTSGSTGTPKGVMISHGNLLFNVEAINQAIQLNSTDVLLGVLPFFHVFGYTVSMWAVAGLDVKGAYHYSPLDAKQIGKMCQEHKGTLLLSTPTFLRSYLRRCEKEQFATLDVVVTGAEKLPADIAAAFKERFGVDPVEGYGATETTPLVSVNIPATRSRGQWHVDAKPGTVGRPVSGVSARVVSLETGEVLPQGEQGMLQISGPNVMQGYWERPDLTSEVIQQGWYVTGDIATIDADGFITITGRQSRFSKIGGEMVPHIHVEEMINQLLGSGDEEMKAAVTAVTDPKKGERLVVLHTKIDKTADEVRRGLSEAGLANLFLPSCFFEVEKIPVLGTGKLDLKGLKSLAEEKVADERAVEA